MGDDDLGEMVDEAHREAIHDDILELTRLLSE